MRRLPDKLAGETPAVGKTRARGNTNGCRVRDRGASSIGRTARVCGRYGRTWARKGKRHGAGTASSEAFEEQAARSGNDGPAGNEGGALRIRGSRGGKTAFPMPDEAAGKRSREEIYRIRGANRCQ